MCRIGQPNRCGTTGCEFSKAFFVSCWGVRLISNSPSYQQERRKFEGVKLVGYTSDSVDYVVRKKKKPGRVVKEEKKYIEVKKQAPQKQSAKTETDFINKITTASQDDWIKKIKTI